VLVQALAKGDYGEFAVELATEVGVADPVSTAGLAALACKAAQHIVFDAAAPSGLTDLVLPADGEAAYPLL
jgi:hypothetical protein